MSDIDIRRSHVLSLPDARKQAESMAAELRTAFDLESQWDGNTLRFSRQGVNGALEVGKSEVRITAQLGFLLAFLKPQIERHINDNLDRIFAAAGKTIAKSPAKAASSKSTRTKR